MRKQQHHPDDPAQPRRSLFRRFDDLAMRFYGPAARSPRNLRGQEEPTQEVRDWYQNLQDEFVVEKDAQGNTYLRPRER